MDGIVVVNKEKGFTSHDVVNVIRKIFQQKKVGHTGTLDPDATGVLPVCLGKATKTCDMLTFSDKCYRAKVRLGLTTDTQDISGEVLSQSLVNVSENELLKAIDSFRGNISQIPPMYSALKINGQKLCDLARKGIEVERKPRDITVYSIEMSEFNGTEFVLDVHCSKGTYIRTLCHDIGQFLGCGAVMTELQRTKSSVFTLDMTHTLDELKDLRLEERLNEALIPTDYVFSHYPALTVNETVKKRLCNGAFCTIVKPLGTYRVYDGNGDFLCIAEVRKGENKNIIKVVKAFYGN